MMAGVHQGKPRIVPADISKLLKQREKITEFLKCDNTADTQVGVNETEEHLLKGENSGPIENIQKVQVIGGPLHEKEDHDVFSYDGELTILEGYEAENNPKEVDNIANIDHDAREEGTEKGESSAPAMNDLKNTINEVFWDKINSKCLINTSTVNP